jgi:hypothetical protein
MATITATKEQAMTIYETHTLRNLLKNANKRVETGHYYCMEEYENLINFRSRIIAELERRGERIA